VKFEVAREIGLGCGLQQPYEWVNNAVHTASMFMRFDDIPGELDELHQDALAHGVKFAKICGCAYLSDTDDYCYICQKLQALRGEKSCTESI
jgi:hypothetical protein